MEVTETQLPGIGTRYTATFRSGGELIVLVHNEGHQEVYWREKPDSDSEKLYSVSERQARKLAEIFDGTYFQPVDDDLDKVWEDAHIEWVELPSDSPVIGQTIREVGIRTNTGAIVIAVQRGPKTIQNPEAEFRLERGDVLVVVGAEDNHEALETLLAAADSTK